MVFNDEEKRVVGKTLEYGLEDPLSAIQLGLTSLYHPKKENMEFIDAMYNCAKRMLVEIAEKRKISANLEDSFELSEIIKDDKGLGIAPEEMINKDELDSIIKEITKDMDYHEIDNLSNKFGGFESLNDEVRVFMKEYIERMASAGRSE